MQEESQQHLVKNSTSTKTKTKQKQKQKSKSKPSKSNSVTWQTKTRTRQHRQTWTKATIITKQTQRTKTKTVTKSPLSTSVVLNCQRRWWSCGREQGRRKEATRKQATGRRKSSVLRNNLVWLFAKREEEKDSPSLHPSNQEDATITLRTMNVIISVVRKGGKKKEAST